VIFILLPRAVRETVAGDLEEVRRSGRVSCWQWYRLVVASVVVCWSAQLRDRAGLRSSGSFPNRRESGLTIMWDDALYTLRFMRRSPGFTLAVVLTLALGIGANTATFSIVNVVALKPLKYKNPSRLAFLLGMSTVRRELLYSLALADALAIRQQTQTLDDVVTYRYWSANITGGSAPERAQAYLVTGNTFSLLGAEPAYGRALTLEDSRPDADDVVVLSHGLWQRRFGGAQSAVGQSMTIDGVARTIVGVMPRDFEYPVFNFKGELWAPAKVDLAGSVPRYGSEPTMAIGRLKDGISYERAQAELDAIMKRLEADNPQTNRGVGVRVLEMRRFGAAEDPSATQALVVLMTSVGFVLLLACVNVGNLLLARAVARERELAVRAALGAGRSRLVRLLLTESAVLAACGALVGIGVAYLALRSILAWLPDMLLTTMPNVLDLGIDRATLAFTAAIAVATAFVFGGIPALRATEGALHGSLKSGTRSTAGPRHQRVRTTLMVGEIAIAVVVLVCAGLLVRAFSRLQRVDLGFNPDSVLTMLVSLPEYRYGTDEARRSFFEHAVDEVRRVAGVRSAAFVNTLPFSTYNSGSRYAIDGVAPPEPGREPRADNRIMSPDYLQTLEIPLLAGRAFDQRDAPTSLPVAIVNRTLALRAFGRTDAIGRRLKMARAESSIPWMTIVGVVGDVHHSDVTAPPHAEIYTPLAQGPTKLMMLAVRTVGDPDALAGAVRGSIARVDPLQPVYEVKTMRRAVDFALMPSSTAMGMMSLFGALALLLATVGIYGVVSYAVLQQKHDFGVRLALGATPGDVLRCVLSRGFRLIGVGTFIGLVLALVASRLLTGLLYGVSAIDGPTYLFVAVVLAAVGGCACYVPARRAMRLDPVAVLRSE